MDKQMKACIICSLVCLALNLVPVISDACKEKETRSFAEIDTAMKQREAKCTIK